MGSKDKISPVISEHSSLKDFLLLETSRENEVQRGYWDRAYMNYVLVGWTKEGEPIFVDNGQGIEIWQDTAMDNTGNKVSDRLYWRVDQSAGGNGRMLPSFVKINSKNMWLEIDIAIPVDYVRQALLYVINHPAL